MVREWKGSVKIIGMKKKKVKLLKYTTILVITFFLIELVSYIFLKFDSTELFNIRNYIEKTNDKRYFTFKRNHSSEEINPYTKKNWSIISSNERLRITKYDNKITHYLSEDNFEEKILFLGDSIPFGWGVNAEDSLPYIFKKYNKKLSVLNAALPSYSLAQTVERYKKEFKELKNLRFVYLQVYNHVPAYALFGTKWETDYNWANFPEKLVESYYLKKINLPFYGESYFYNFLRKKVYRIIKKKKHKERLYDDRSDQKFINYVNFNLEKIYNLIDNKKVSLIVSSITTPKFSDNTKSKSHLRALGIFNKNLKEFSLKNKGVFYFDISTKLDLESKKMFIDSCCHLSNMGANLMAQELAKLIKKIL